MPVSVATGSGTSWYLAVPQWSMGLAKPVFTPQEAEALAAAAQHVLGERDSATLALGQDPRRIQDALRALDKLRQHVRR